MHRCPVHPDFETFQFRPNARELSERLLVQACGDRRFEKFVQFLETEWARKHAKIMHDAAAPIGQDGHSSPSAIELAFACARIAT